MPPPDPPPSQPAPPTPPALARILPQRLRDAREWIARADEDLQAADRVLTVPPPLLGTAAYHAQQAAEKALKAFLAAHGVAFRPTHDLVELASECRRIDAGFGPFLAMAQTLTPYASARLHAARVWAPDAARPGRRGSICT